MEVRGTPSIAKITGTYGTEVQNGVGRFLAALDVWSRKQGLPLRVFSAGDHLPRYDGVEKIHSLAFPVPGGFKAIEAYYPLKGRRKQLARAIKAINPDIVHVSTPEALGATAAAIARRQKRLLAGIYHTDFPAFAHQVLRQAFDQALRKGADNALFRTVRDEIKANTTWWERSILRFVLWRNRHKLDAFRLRGAEWLAKAACNAVRGVMGGFYRPFDLVITRSEIYRRKLIDELNLSPDRVRTLRCGVDTNLFTPERGDADQGLRERLGLPPDSRIILYVGRVTDEKNVGFLADAWRSFQKQTRRSGPPAAFVLAGSGNLEEFQRRAGPGVHLLGACHGTMLSAVFRLADLFWTASTTETLGQVVLEAQASGVPVIVGDQGAVQENVGDGRTGRILSMDSPEHWAAEASRLLANRERLRAMGQAAREFAESHSIEASFRHYWELHEQLRAENVEARRPRRRTSTIPDWTALPPAKGEFEPPRGSPATHVSDFHVGKRSKRIPKEAALRAACRRCAERGARFFMHGDFLDTRPPIEKFRLEVDMVRRVLDEYRIVPAAYLEGNHDYEFGRAGKIESLLGCPVAPALIQFDVATGLVLTHGHISELHGIQGMLDPSRSREELIQSLTIERLKEPLKVSALEYDLVDVVTRYLRIAGLEGLEDAWRYTFEIRRWLADFLLEMARKRSLDDKVVKAVIQMIGSSDREEILARLCAALGGWGLVYGHTHEPHLARHQVIDPRTGETRVVLLGNSGSFRRRSVPPTWIESNFPHLELWAYIASNESARLVERISLTPEEAAPYERLWAAREPSSAVLCES